MTATPTAPVTPERAPCQARPRLIGWIALTVALMVAVWAIAPQQLPVSLYKLSLVSLAGVVGYWLDRSLFPYARPEALLGRCHLAETDSYWFGSDAQRLNASEDSRRATALRLTCAAMLRRAIIVGASMLAMGLGA